MNRIDGYIAAPFTHMMDDGSINLDPIEDYADFLIRNGLDGAFICGSSGEGALLSTEERMSIAEKWMEKSGSKLKIIVHIGGTILSEQQKLAKHAERIGAFAFATMSPIFLGPKRVEELGEYLKQVAQAAPNLPFYYYHVPPLTGIDLSVVELLKSYGKIIPNLAGVKFTCENMYEFDQCKWIENGKYEMLHGYDETFLSALAFGYKSGIGGTYNHCFGIYKDMRKAFEKNDLVEAQRLQHVSHLFINILIKYRGNIVGGKRIMKFLGIDCGPNRLPLQTISKKEEEKIKRELDQIGFFNFCNK